MPSSNATPPTLSDPPATVTPKPPHDRTATEIYGERDNLELVAGLVLLDASPTKPAPAQAQRLRESLQSWPRPFPSHSHAVEFFGGGPRGHAWADGLQYTPTGWWPRFDLDTVACLADTAGDTWTSWRAITCPTTVLRAGHGSFITDHDADQMSRTGPRPEVITVAGAGHDIHLDQPSAVRRPIETIGPGRER